MLNEKLGKIQIQPIRIFHTTIESSPKQSIFKPIIQSISTNIDKFWDRSMEDFIEDLTQKSEIKLWEKIDRYGQNHWCTRDPKTGKTISFASELEMRGWMETHDNHDRW
jgi:hypothetical protein